MTVSNHTWPGSLPEAPRADGSFSSQREQGFLSSGVDAGPEKRRRRTSATIANQTMNVLCKNGQEDILDDFYHTTLMEGSLSFVWYDFSASGPPWPERDFLFASPPEFQRQEDPRFVVVRLELIRLPTSS